MTSFCQLVRRPSLLCITQESNSWRKGVRGHCILSSVLHRAPKLQGNHVLKQVLNNKSKGFKNTFFKKRKTVVFAWIYQRSAHPY
jgi:hypothetical protein